MMRLERCMRKKRAKRRRKLRILGDARGLMMICRDIRRRWAQYGENRKEALAQPFCASCKVGMVEEVDHIEPVGPRPRSLVFLGLYALRMFTLRCQGLCIKCHLLKTKEDRKRRLDDDTIV
jgi:hypothetical protein